MNAAEIHDALHQIQTLAKEIEDIPNFGPDVWSMQKVDEKCREIRRLCELIGRQIGTGHQNTGYQNTGHQNTGHQNTGHQK
jgi:hypothetical protein